jgi:PAS domain S-box-containing protein
MGRGTRERSLKIRAGLGELFERTPVPIFVVNREAWIVSANESAISYLGYSIDELLERRIPDLVATPWDDSMLVRTFAGEEVDPMRRPLLRKDGSTSWATSRSSVVHFEGEPLVAAMVQDVTATVTAEDVARVSAQREVVLWDAAVERASRSFALLDAECRIIRANGPLHRRLRKTAPQVEGTLCREIFGRCQTPPCPHQMALAERRNVIEEIVTRNGLPLRIEVWPAAPNDVGIALVHVAEDLTEERALRSRLVTADRLACLGRVTAAVAHEVNNPAAFVLLALPLIRDCVRQGRKDDALGLVDNASDAMMQITAIMRDLRDFGRGYPRSVVDLAALANGALRIAAYEAEPRARIERDFEEGVAADVRGGRVAQVILNLVLNAAQAIPAGDPKRHRIEIRVRKVEDRAVVEVADSGTGVPEEIGERIFEPFFTTRGDLGGTGLGLWLSRTIVEEEGGTLTWRNGTPAGAVFTMSLPLERSPTRDA